MPFKVGDRFTLPPGTRELGPTKDKAGPYGKANVIAYDRDGDGKADAWSQKAPPMQGDGVWFGFDRSVPGAPADTLFTAPDGTIKSTDTVFKQDDGSVVLEMRSKIPGWDMYFAEEFVPAGSPRASSGSPDLMVDGKPYYEARDGKLYRNDTGADGRNELLWGERFDFKRDDGN